MTDEERQSLCEDLRQGYRYIANDEINNIIWRAADEIEWLAESLEAAHGYADECEAKIKFLSDQIDNLGKRSAW